MLLLQQEKHPDCWVDMEEQWEMEQRWIACPPSWLRAAIGHVLTRDHLLRAGRVDRNASASNSARRPTTRTLLCLDFGVWMHRFGMYHLHNKKSTLTSWVDMEQQWEMEQQCEMLEEKC